MPRRRSRGDAVVRRDEFAACVPVTPPTVIIFLKAPRPGYVKTRLAVSIGSAAATRVYRQLAERQLDAIPPGWPVEIHYAPRGASRQMRAWLGRRPRYWLQRGEELGPRLTAAFAAAFARGSDRVLAIGADCPDLDAVCLNAAANALDHVDVVIGPAKDGGYYLIGMRRNLPHLFAEIPWSSPAVFRTTLERARAAKASVHLLAEKEDIDDAEALQRYQRRQQSTYHFDRDVAT